MKERFSREELAVLEKILRVMSEELMPEVENIKKELIPVEE